MLPSSVLRMVVREGVQESRWHPSRRLVGLGAVGAAGLSVLWLVVVPAQVADATGWRELALRWGHSACWALLALAGATHALRGPRAVVSGAAWAGLAAYVAFLAAMVDA